MRSCSWTAVRSVLLTSPLTSRSSLPSFQVTLPCLPLSICRCGFMGICVSHLICCLLVYYLISTPLIIRLISATRGIIYILTTPLDICIVSVNSFLLAVIICYSNVTSLLFLFADCQVSVQIPTVFLPLLPLHVQFKIKFMFCVFSQHLSHLSLR